MYNGILLHLYQDFKGRLVIVNKDTVIQVPSKRFLSDIV